MVLRTFCLAIVALAACAGGENLPESSGFSGGAWTTPQTMPASASQVSGDSVPTTSDSDSDGVVTTDMIRPDFGSGESSTGGPDVTTGADPTNVTATTADPGTTTVMGPECGDGLVEAPEECEAVDLKGQSCMTLGFTGGTLKCAANCVFDKSQCVSESCGDGTLNGGEECDCGQQGANCTAPQLANMACANLVAPANGNYHGGTLACGSPQSCLFNKAGCIYCGDGVRNGPEACEGGDLGGQTCNGLGFSGGGTLSCNANCTHNTGGCVNIACGDGVCNGGEDDCTCPDDCPEDPNSCSSCECGGFSTNCACDPDCVFFGDCCFNGPC
ncbi:hypothetical protein [Nannocystis radixulma]|uniref:Uncharacterized protein n=1 Tax=Nannocystis radixulma TaxID=2995305 RepID=A0ABT5B978_9BACT|nr:hypothetical protein [Nannocystis radixulma]MDC0670685.1 hypothetical protein [Nannocystis radixulma]